VLILKSKRDGRLIIEDTKINPQERLKLHNLGKIEKTKNTSLLK
jgi:hypothetical protein